MKWRDGSALWGHASQQSWRENVQKYAVRLMSVHMSSDTTRLRVPTQLWEIAKVAAMPCHGDRTLSNFDERKRIAGTCSRAGAKSVFCSKFVLHVLQMALHEWLDGARLDNDAPLIIRFIAYRQAVCTRSLHWL